MTREKINEERAKLAKRSKNALEAADRLLAEGRWQPQSVFDTLNELLDESIKQGAEQARAEAVAQARSERERVEAEQRADVIEALAAPLKSGATPTDNRTLRKRGALPAEERRRPSKMDRADYRPIGQ